LILCITVILVMLTIAFILIYLSIKIPTLKVEREAVKASNSKTVDLDFYIKEQQGIANLFLKIRNLTHEPIFSISGVLKKYFRSMQESIEFFKCPILEGDGEVNFYLTSLLPLKKYYVDVRVEYTLHGNHLESRASSEFLVP